MRRLIFLLGLLAFGLVISYNLYAFRMPKPDKITEINEATLTRLNIILEELWDITNGRYNLDIVIINPDGNTKGNIGDMLLFNNSGTYYLAINTTGAKIWRSILLTDIP